VQQAVRVLVWPASSTRSGATARRTSATTSATAAPPRPPRRQPRPRGTGTCFAPRASSVDGTMDRRRHLADGPRLRPSTLRPRRASLPPPGTLTSRVNPPLRGGELEGAVARLATDRLPNRPRVMAAVRRRGSESPVDVRGNRAACYHATTSRRNAPTRAYSSSVTSPEIRGSSLNETENHAAKRRSRRLKRSTTAGVGPRSRVA
jgi:hypothetical protein